MQSQQPEDAMMDTVSVIIHCFVIRSLWVSRELLEVCHIRIIKDPGILDQSQDVDLHKPFTMSCRDFALKYNF